MPSPRRIITVIGEDNDDWSVAGRLVNVSLHDIEALDKGDITLDDLTFGQSTLVVASDNIARFERMRAISEPNPSSLFNPKWYRKGVQTHFKTPLSDDEWARFVQADTDLGSDYGINQARIESIGRLLGLEF